MQTSADTPLTTYLIAEQARFYRLAYSYLRQREDALDAVQSAVCRALERQDSLRDPELIRPWFYRILINTCLDALRRRSRVVPLEDWAETGREDPPPPDEDLSRQVEALRPPVSTVIKLRFYEGLSLREISEATGSNVNTVKSRLYAGLKKLRISMEGEDIT